MPHPAGGHRADRDPDDPNVAPILQDTPGGGLKRKRLRFQRVDKCAVPPSWPRCQLIRRGTGGARQDGLRCDALALAGDAVVVAVTSAIGVVQRRGDVEVRYGLGAAAYVIGGAWLADAVLVDDVHRSAVAERLCGWRRWRR